jgi:hypothetical protein
MPLRGIDCPFSVRLDLNHPGQHCGYRETHHQHDGQEAKAPGWGCRLFQQEVEHLRAQPGAGDVDAADVQHAAAAEFGKESRSGGVA